MVCELQDSQKIAFRHRWVQLTKKLASLTAIPMILEIIKYNFRFVLYYLQWSLIMLYVLNFTWKLGEKTPPSQVERAKIIKPH